MTRCVLKNVTGKSSPDIINHGPFFPMFQYKESHLQQISAVKQEKEETAMQLSELHTQVEMLQNQAKVHEEKLQKSSTDEDKIGGLQEELEDLQAIIKDLRNKHDVLKSENLELKSGSVEDKKQVAEGQRESEELMNELKLREGRLEELQEKYDSISEERKVLQEQLEKVKTESQSTLDKHKKASSELEETKRILSEVVEAGTKHEVERKAADENLEMVKSEKSKVEEELQEKLKLIEIYEPQIQSHMKAIEDLTDEREKLTEEQKELATKLKEQDDLVVTLRDEVTLLQDGLDKEVKVNMGALEVRLEKAVESRKAIEAEKSAMDTELEDTKRKLMELNQEHEDMKAELNIKIDSIRQELDRVVTEKNEVSNKARNPIGPCAVGIYSNRSPYRPLRKRPIAFNNHLADRLTLMKTALSVW